jgi:hypothetical protein
MKLIAVHLAQAVKFARLAALESTPEVRKQLEKRADAYRKLAEKRAKKLGTPLPGKPH